ncbi:MAG TPA: argininosuccinate synthase, partial [Dehalococcoidia bacterium]|nr:argininosuccinate synthase [Dehalococcoidia bacterium]
AYSGGLDTSVAIRWLSQEREYDVIALTVDVGNEKDLKTVQARATEIGAVKSLVRDARADFIHYFAFPALAAGAVYQGVYPLATALARPLIAKLLVDVAREEGATAVAHGCTGKGNDQVRFDVSVHSLAPDLEIIAPVREWAWSREEEIEYAAKHGIPVPVTKQSPYSTDENLWGRSIEAGVLEDPWAEPPADVYEWTAPPADRPAEADYLEIGFREGVPVSLDDEEVSGVDMVTRLNTVAGKHGIGRVDHVEDRLVGIKSREIYEAPAAVTLLEAHKALEHMTLSRQQLAMKARIAQEYADLIYNGLWFTAHHQDLAAYVRSTQRHVTGSVRVKLHNGSATAVGRRSDSALYDYSLATYDRGDTYDQGAAVGFIKVFGLPAQVQARAQLLKQPEGPLQIATPHETDE